MADTNRYEPMLHTIKDPNQGLWNNIPSKDTQYHLLWSSAPTNNHEPFHFVLAGTPKNNPGGAPTEWIIRSNIVEWESTMHLRMGKDGTGYLAITQKNHTWKWPPSILEGNSCQGEVMVDFVKDMPTPHSIGGGMAVCQPLRDDAGKAQGICLQFRPKHFADLIGIMIKANRIGIYGTPAAGKTATDCRYRLDGIGTAMAHLVRNGHYQVSDGQYRPPVGLIDEAMWINANRF